MRTIAGHKFEEGVGSEIDIAVDDLLLGVPPERQVDVLFDLLAVAIARCGDLIGEEATLLTIEGLGPTLRKGRKDAAN